MDRILCPYCGCGCVLNAVRGSDGKTIERILPDKTDIVSEGSPCMKGLTVHEVIDTNRLSYPMMRENKHDPLQPCSWKDAYDRIAKEFEESRGRHGGSLRNSLYFIGSGECTNESNYLMSKLARSCFGTNNIDSCARLCHASTAYVFKQMFGMAAIPCYSMEDLRDGDLFLFVGTDPMEDYPVMFNRVLDARKRGAVIVTVDVAGSGTSAQAEYAVSISPDGIIPLIAHMIVMLVDGGDMSRDACQFEGYEGFVASARRIAQENPPSSFRCTRDDIRTVYQLLNDSKKPVLGFGMGLTQHANGTENVYAFSGLALLLDAVLFPNRGKVNVQGAGDVGCDPLWRPNDSAASAGWDMGFVSHGGIPMTEALYDDAIECVWVMGSNVSQSMPDLNSLDESFRKKFIIYQHHHPGRTMDIADVVLPVIMLVEESGSITNGERRVRGIYRENTMGADRDLKTNTQVLIECARSLGAKGFDFANEQGVFREMASVTPGYEALELENVMSNEGQFANKQPAYKRFMNFSYRPQHFKKSGYPYVLTTARNRFQFCSGVMSRTSKTLRNLAGVPAVFINPADAEMLNISDGSDIRVISEVGEITAQAKLDIHVEKRVIVAPLHFDTLLVNRLTPRILDPISKTPCFKEVSVRIERV